MKKNKPKWIIIHHEGGSNGFESVNRQHRNDPNIWLGHLSDLGHAMGYHFYIDEESIKQARMVYEIGAHTKGMNGSSIGICLRGNYSKKDRYPSDKIKDALKGLLVDLMKKYDIPLKRIVPHRFFYKTECYGKNLSDDWARKLIEEKDIVVMPDMPDMPKSRIEIKLLKDKITIIEQMIRIYVKLKSLFALLKLKKN